LTDIQQVVPEPRQAETRFRAFTARHLDTLTQRAGLSDAERLAVRAVATVLPFRTNSYVLDELIDWEAAPDDPMYRLVFPQPDMLPGSDVSRMAGLLSENAPESRIHAAAHEIRMRLNPHPAGQLLLNPPSLEGRPLPGLQHKYPETVLFFPRQGQTCHAYCSYCFRWAQFVDEPDLKMATDDIGTLVAYLRELVATKRRNPADDLVSVLLAAGDDALTTQELLSSLFQLVVAGHDTTASLIGNGVVALLDYPRQLQALLADPGRMPAAIDELIRFTAPVPHATFRVTTEPVTVGGVEIPAREQVLVCLGSANRDPGRFPAPHALDIGRGDGTNLGLGHGIHYCLGAPLARLEARVAFEALLGRHPGLLLAADRDALTWTRGDGLVLRGLTSLPVVLGPSSIPAKSRRHR